MRRQAVMVLVVLIVAGAALSLPSTSPAQVRASTHDTKHKAKCKKGRHLVHGKCVTKKKKISPTAAPIPTATPVPPTSTPIPTANTTVDDRGFTASWGYFADTQTMVFVVSALPPSNSTVRASRSADGNTIDISALPNSFALTQTLTALAMPALRLSAAPCPSSISTVTRSFDPLTGNVSFDAVNQNFAASPEWLSGATPLCEIIGGVPPQAVFAPDGTLAKPQITYSRVMPDGGITTGPTRRVTPAPYQMIGNYTPIDSAYTGQLLPGPGFGPTLSLTKLLFPFLAPSEGSTGTGLSLLSTWTASQCSQKSSPEVAFCGIPVDPPLLLTAEQVRRASPAELAAFAYPKSAPVYPLSIIVQPSRQFFSVYGISFFVDITFTWAGGCPNLATGTTSGALGFSILSGNQFQLNFANAVGSAPITLDGKTSVTVSSSLSNGVMNLNLGGSGVGSGTYAVTKAGCTDTATFTSLPHFDLAKLLSVPLEPKMSASAPSFTFPDQAIGTTSNPQTITMTNKLGKPVTLVALLGDHNFPIPGVECAAAKRLEPGQSCDITVVFAPREAVDHNAILTLVFKDDNDQTNRVQIPLIGRGTIP